ncbi:DUF1761 domain-containing protein [Parasphingorhabdus sp.]|uniref:DUF1761 domain-containing protein n=1 Tax=Parasphingorhabdus sp. TaxID=2709688 RepID=UPI0032EB2067
MEISWIAIIAAGISSMVLGAIWYAPPVFGKAWQAAAGLSDETVQGGNPAIIYGGATLLSLLAAGVFSMFLGPKPELGFAFGAGLSAGLCWVAASFGINYLFERKSLKLWVINGGYHTIQFTLFGIILSLLG